MTSGNTSIQNASVTLVSKTGNPYYLSETITSSVNGVYSFDDVYSGYDYDIIITLSPYKSIRTNIGVVTDSISKQYNLVAPIGFSAIEGSSYIATGVTYTVMQNSTPIGSIVSGGTIDLSDGSYSCTVSGSRYISQTISFNVVNGVSTWSAPVMQLGTWSHTFATGNSSEYITQIKITDTSISGNPVYTYTPGYNVNNYSVAGLEYGHRYTYVMTVYNGSSSWTVSGNLFSS